MAGARQIKELEQHAQELAQLESSLREAEASRDAVSANAAELKAQVSRCMEAEATALVRNRSCWCPRPLVGSCVAHSHPRCVVGTHRKNCQRHAKKWTPRRRMLSSLPRLPSPLLKRRPQHSRKYVLQCGMRRLNGKGPDRYHDRPCLATPDLVQRDCALDRLRAASSECAKLKRSLQVRLGSSHCRC